MIEYMSPKFREEFESEKSKFGSRQGEEVKGVKE